MSGAPTIWRDMTDAEKGALLLADHRGEPIDCQGPQAGYPGWVACIPQWVDDYAYRVKPAPKVETQELKMCLSSNGRIFLHHTADDRCTNITHTYTITDGCVTACDTIIHD